MAVKTSLVAALVALFALATPVRADSITPPSLDGKQEIAREAGPVMVAGVVHTVEVVRYSDGAAAVFVNGRLYAMDPNPADRCAPYYRDRGMLSEDGRREIPEAEWRAPDWELRPSQASGCPRPV